MHAAIAKDEIRSTGVFTRVGADYQVVALGIVVDPNVSGPVVVTHAEPTRFSLIGDRERANYHAGRIDARPGSTIALTNGALVCACGSPFDLEATPKLKARIEQGGLSWPPPVAIHFPDKDW